MNYIPFAIIYVQILDILFSPVFGCSVHQVRTLLCHNYFIFIQNLDIDFSVKESMHRWRPYSKILSKFWIKLSQLQQLLFVQGFIHVEAYPNLDKISWIIIHPNSDSLVGY